MCTGILYNSDNHYFGRNLDLEISFGQKVTITPRNYEFKFREVPDMKSHLAIIGMAMIADNYPLYFDAANEAGLGMAGLAYAGNATYMPSNPKMTNVASFEFIPYILGQAKTVAEAKKLMENLNITNTSFSKETQASPLHWILGDKTGASITVEPDADGLHVYDNPTHTLTNNPPFPIQLLNLGNYAGITPGEPKNTLLPGVDINYYSRSLGTHNLPGGMDSEGRFVKVSFALQHAPKGKSEDENVTNYFHVLESVAQPKGLDEVAPNTFEYTIYSDCMNLETGMYYYTTYENNQISAVDMHKVDLDGSELSSYATKKSQEINYQN